MAQCPHCRIRFGPPRWLKAAGWLAVIAVITFHAIVAHFIIKFW